MGGLLEFVTEPFELLPEFSAVLVFSTLGFLSLSLSWVFVTFNFHCGSFHWVGLLRCLAFSLRGRAEVVSARLNPRNGTLDVGGVCDFLCSVSSRQKFEARDRPELQSSDGPVSQLLNGPGLQLRVTAQFYLENKGICILILKAWGHADPKDTKRREAPSPILAPLFKCFFLLPLGLPY